MWLACFGLVTLGSMVKYLGFILLLVGLIFKISSAISIG